MVVIFGAFKAGFSLGGNAFACGVLTIEGKKKSARASWRFSVRNGFSE